MSDIENMMDNINKKTKEIIDNIERKSIELESVFMKNNYLILKTLRDLLLKYKVTYKCISLVFIYF